MEPRSITTIDEIRDVRSAGPEMLEPVTLLPLFAYGPLEDETFVGHLLERAVVSEPAVLPDFELIELVGLVSPIVVESPGQEAEGRLYRHLTVDDYVRLDSYAGVMEGLYQRITVEVVARKVASEEAPEDAFLYMPTDQILKSYA